MDRTGWPDITVTVRGAALPFRALPLPSERAELVRFFDLAGEEARALVTAAQADDATKADVVASVRALLLVEGRTGYVLMRLWAGEPSVVYARWKADAVAGEGHVVHYPGEDHKLLAGRAFLGELSDATGVPFELAQKIAVHLLQQQPPKAEPDGVEVDEITSFFGVPQGDTTGL